MYAIDQPQTPTNTELEDSILKVLAWFDLFNYPLTAGEVLFFLDCVATPEAVKASLHRLADDHMVFLHDEFYLLQDNMALVTRRKKGNDKAAKMLKTAYRVAKVLYHFPYVRAVCISGSLSKHFADEKADIDLFIITSANRLWIARMATVLLRKCFGLIGKQHWFCLNYFIDEEALQIPEKNTFVAIELITLLPVCGGKTVENFFAANNWARSIFCNYEEKKAIFEDTGKGYRLKKCIEWLFNKSMGDALDNFLMQFYDRRIKRKDKQGRLLNMHGEKFDVENSKHFNKPTPHLFQRRIMDRYLQKLDAVFAKRSKRLQATNHEL